MVKTISETPAEQDLSVGFFMSEGYLERASYLYAPDYVHAREMILPGNMVLDAGCGAGTGLPILSWAAGKEGRVIGVDPCPKFIEVARNQVGEIGLNNVELYVADARDLGEEKSGKYDAITCCNVLYALPREEADRMLLELNRVCKPGGQIFVSALGTGFRDYLLTNPKFGPKGVTQEKLDYLLAQTSFYTESEIDAALKTAGFEIDKRDTIELSAAYPGLAQGMFLCGEVPAYRHEVFARKL
ncbi:MAG: class I SAM-dependent methyltransferase [Candidatus Aenigmarchaeota archaeon]|nr:class I SAM-dependent methyltransferase [Candidatus Aenigmarchaeota archaeon]